MKLKFGNHIKLKKKVSLFVKCSYDEGCLEYIHSFSRAYYHKEQRMWELDQSAFHLLVTECTNVIICGDVPPKYKKYLKLLDKYEQSDNCYDSKTKPYKHQIDAFNYALSNRSFLLGDEQGLGKTKQALDIAVSRSHKFKHCLIVCGVNGLKWNWLNEIGVHTNRSGYILGMQPNGKIGTVEQRYNDLLKAHDELFIITNIETLRDKRISKEIENMCASGLIGMTIIDEIHKAKNYSSQQGKAIHCCSSFYRLALTGTPLMNSPMDLYNILKWLGYENHTYTQFEDYYAEKGGFGNYEIIGYKNLDKLKQLLDRHMLRRKKEEVLDLPSKIYINEILEMDATQKSIYNELHTETIQLIDKILLDRNPLSKLTRLRQATSCPHKLTTKKVGNVKIDRIVDIVEECPDKVIIFSNFTSTIYPVAEALKDYNPAIVTGEEKDTDSAITKFKQDPNCKVILGTVPCLGTGFTLTEASAVVFCDEPWNMANKLQAEDRAHRIGTTKPVSIYTLLCKDTIDIKINEVVKQKGELSDYLVDQSLSQQDIRNLLV